MFRLIGYVIFVIFGLPQIPQQHCSPLAAGPGANTPQNMRVNHSKLESSMIILLKIEPFGMFDVFVVVVMQLRWDPWGNRGVYHWCVGGTAHWIMGSGGVDGRYLICAENKYPAIISCCSCLFEYTRLLACIFASPL